MIVYLNWSCRSHWEQNMVFLYAKLKVESRQNKFLWKKTNQLQNRNPKGNTV